jgi:UDPglucose--hexose-1-phosphate uridylyltransferase
MDLKGKRSGPLLGSDRLTAAGVLFAPDRSKRPRDNTRDKATESCPFCPGNEHLTPPTLLALPDTKSWQVRVFENLYPFIARGAGKDQAGIQEVIVETPEHDAEFRDLGVKNISLVLQAFRDRIRYHQDNSLLRSVMVFRNQGFRGGASLVHPHSQLVGLSFVPPRLAAEQEGFLRLAEKGWCPLCLDKGNPLIILEEGAFRVFSPDVPRFPREVWIAPAGHEPAFSELKNGELDDMASLLKKVLTGLKQLLTPFDYNLVVHTEPFEDSSGTFHTHLEILPRSEALAGFEIGSGLYVNPVPPEQTVAELREAILRKS